MLKEEMRRICDPEVLDAQAFADQDAMIEAYGGKSVAATMGAPSATPPPET